MMSGFIRSVSVESFSWLAASVHSLFYHRDECWVSDLANMADAGLKRAVIIFAPSAGEVMSMLPLLNLLKSSRPDTPILVLTTTNSGAAAARNRGLYAARSALAARSVYRRLIDRIEPKGLIIVQVSYAPGLLLDLMAEAKSCGLPAVVVNGSLPDRDIRRASSVFYRSRSWVYDVISAFCMRSAEDADRVIRLGVQPSKVRVAGDMKYDAALEIVDEERLRMLVEELGLAGVPVVAAGSTHSGEERIVLDAFRRLCDKIGYARLIVAPRSLSRAGEVRTLARDMGFTAEFRSASEGLSNAQVIVLDSIGELSTIYGAADVCFVGGTLVPVGGHNVLEPAAWGRPVLFGEHTEHTADAAELLLGGGGAAVVNCAEDLSERLIELIVDSELRRKMGESAFSSVRSMAGASKACFDVIERVIFGSSNG